MDQLIEKVMIKVGSWKGGNERKRERNGSNEGVGCFKGLTFFKSTQPGQVRLLVNDATSPR